MLMIDAGVSLENIDLSNQDIGDLGAIDLSTACMADVCAKLKRLELGRNSLTSDGNMPTHQI